MMADPEELAFYRRVEDLFASMRGVPHTLSPIDFQLLRSWWAESVPYEAVLAGMLEAIDRRRDRGEVDPVVSLSYCKHAVAKAAKQLAELRAGGHEGVGDEDTAALREQLDELASVLTELLARLDDGLQSPLRWAIDELGALDTTVIGAAKVDETLYALEGLLLERLRQALPRAERSELESQAASMASGQTAEDLERSRRAQLDRLLRRRLDLPRLELV